MTYPKNYHSTNRSYDHRYDNFGNSSNHRVKASRQKKALLHGQLEKALAVDQA